MYYNYHRDAKMDKRIDLRIIKTKKVLFASLLSLMKQKDFDKIKVSDICEEALINRSTFYAHYEDKYDLLIDLVEDLKNNILKELKVNPHDNISKDYFMNLLSILINHIDEHRDIYSAIIIHNKNSFLIDFLSDVINRDISQRLENNYHIDSNIPISTIVKLYLGGIVNIGVDWIINPNKYTKEEILTYLNRLIPDKI